MKKIGVLLAGSGVYDGSEIQEAVFALLAIAQRGGAAVCLAPNKTQYHVLNHLDGSPMPESRNVLIESARIARGAVTDVAMADANQLDALVIPGGFGAAKNLNQWAIEGPAGPIDPHVRALIQAMVVAQKPVVGLCMGPTVIAKALENTGVSASLTVGTTTEPSPYDIAGIHGGMQALGASVQERTLREVEVDQANRIITAPCYMMEGNIADVHDNIQQAIAALFEMLG
jgi:enhancing lycopene biosynthesis protein 2